MNSLLTESEETLLDKSMPYLVAAFGLFIVYVFFGHALGTSKGTEVTLKNIHQMVNIKDVQKAIDDYYVLSAPNEDVDRYKAEANLKDLESLGLLTNDMASKIAHHTRCDDISGISFTKVKDSIRLSISGSACGQEEPTTNKKDKYEYSEDNRTLFITKS